MSSHRSLNAWKVARQVTLAAVQASREYWKPWAAPLFGQLIRCASSTQANIAEGSTFGPSPTYTRHLGIAYGSAVETVEFVELLVAAEVLPPEFGRHLLSLAGHSRQLLLGLLKHHRPFARGKNQT